MQPLFLNREAHYRGPRGEGEIVGPATGPATEFPITPPKCHNQRTWQLRASPKVYFPAQILDLCGASPYAGKSPKDATQDL